MADPLESSRRKVARAKKHIADLEAEIAAFGECRPYLVLKERDPHAPGQEIHKLRPIKLLPDSIGDIVSDAIHNLRDALDTAGYNIAIAGGAVRPRRAAFPFAGSATDFQNNMKGRSKDIPVLFQAVIGTFKPYRGGDDFLWALNDVCNTVKHGTGLISIGFGSVLEKFGMVAGNVISIPVHIWNSAKQEIALGTFSSDAEYDMEISPFIAFDEPEPVLGQSVVTVLDTFCGKVENILMALQAEARRLGYVA